MEARSITWSRFPISEPILKSLQEQRLKRPLPIQIKALKASLLENKNVLGAAQTGSGKTLAYAIPVLNRILTSEYGSSHLKRKLSRLHKKKEDFEIIGGEMISVEDMIVDRVSNSEETDDEQDSDTIESSDSASVCSRTCPEAIVLVPTRELAVQVKEEFDKICSNTEVNSCCIIGGICQQKQVRLLTKRRPHIVIATPGRLYDMIQSDTVDYLNVHSVASVQALVIDEADRMVQKGHFDEMLKIIDIIKESKSSRGDSFPYRVYLFSATLTFLHELPDRLKTNPLLAKESRSRGSKVKKDKKTIDPREHTKKNKIKSMLNLLGIDRAETRIFDLNDQTTFGRPCSEQLTEFRINCITQDKDLFLYYILVQNPNKRILVFCNSKDCLRRLSNVLKYIGYGTLTLHSDMDQKKRLSSLEKFRKRPGAILVATDVAARGLDIEGLDCVVHYQVPKTCESYIHRSGRTARVGRKGTSFTLCEPKEIPFYRRLCNNINGGKDLEDYDVDLELKALLQDRIVLAQQCDVLDHKLRDKKSNSNWFAKAAMECDIELDDEDIRQLGGKGKSAQQNIEEDASDRRRLSVIQKRLNLLLKRPLVTRKSLMKQSDEQLKAIEV